MKGEAMRRKTEKVTNCDYISMKSPEKKKEKKTHKTGSRFVTASGS